MFYPWSYFFGKSSLSALRKYDPIKMSIRTANCSKSTQIAFANKNNEQLMREVMFAVDNYHCKCLRSLQN